MKKQSPAAAAPEPGKAVIAGVSWMRAPLAARRVGKLEEPSPVEVYLNGYEPRLGCKITPSGGEWMLMVNVFNLLHYTQVASKKNTERIWVSSHDSQFTHMFRDG